MHFRIRDYYSLGFSFPADFANTLFCNFCPSKTELVDLQPQTPNPNSLFQRTQIWCLVWALPLSLAATPGITVVLFSSRYWNVLLPWVRATHSRCVATEVYSAGFPHSDIFGSQVAQHLTEAYRSYATSFIAFKSQGIHHTLLISARKRRNHLNLRKLQKFS